MNIARLPLSRTDTPQLLAAVDVDTGRVKWLLDDERSDFKDETNWFIVWRQNDTICVQATRWYHSRGYLRIYVTDITPNEAVALAERAARLASDSMNGNAKLEKTS